MEVVERVRRPRCGAYKSVSASEFYVCMRHRGHKGQHANFDREVRWAR